MHRFPFVTICRCNSDLRALERSLEEGLAGLKVEVASMIERELSKYDPSRPFNDLIAEIESMSGVKVIVQKDLEESIELKLDRDCKQFSKPIIEKIRGLSHSYPYLCVRVDGGRLSLTRHRGTYTWF
jgi:hypothetical protein